MLLLTYLLNVAHDSTKGTRGGEAFPNFYKWLDTETACVTEQQARNWPNCIPTITKALTKTTNCTPKKSFFSDALRRTCVPPPQFQSRSGSTGHDIYWRSHDRGPNHPPGCHGLNQGLGHLSIRFKARFHFRADLTASLKAKKSENDNG